MQRRVFESLAAAGRLRVDPSEPDPIDLVRAYVRAEDREVAGLLAALFAYGQVRSLCAAVEWILERLGPSPHEAVGQFRHRRPGWGRGFRYRFQTRNDLLCLLDAVAVTLGEEGSLENSLGRAVAEAGRGNSRWRGEVFTDGLGRWVQILRRRASPARKRSPGGAERDSAGPVSHGLQHLLADPALGSAGKRWRLFLRWMVRPDDGVDLGLWSKRFAPADLVLPLDTHWIRIGRRLGLTHRRSPGLRMAEEITAALRRLRPEDPLRYDLPVCHFGIGGGCPPRLRPEHCRSCPLRPICPTARGVRAVHISNPPAR